MTHTISAIGGVTSNEQKCPPLLCKKDLCINARSNVNLVIEFLLFRGQSWLHYWPNWVMYVLPGSLQILVTSFLVFRHFGCVIFFTLNFHFACLALHSKKVTKMGLKTHLSGNFQNF